jgi:hypothetical protein
LWQVKGFHRKSSIYTVDRRSARETLAKTLQTFLMVSLLNIHVYTLGLALPVVMSHKNVCDTSLKALLTNISDILLVLCTTANSVQFGVHNVMFRSQHLMKKDGAELSESLSVRTVHLDSLTNAWSDHYLHEDNQGRTRRITYTEEAGPSQPTSSPLFKFFSFARRNSLGVPLGSAKPLMAAMPGDDDPAGSSNYDGLGTFSIFVTISPFKRGSILPGSSGSNKDGSPQPDQPAQQQQQPSVPVELEAAQGESVEAKSSSQDTKNQKGREKRFRKSITSLANHMWSMLSASGSNMEVETAEEKPVPVKRGNESDVDISEVVKT